jgi:hypothetical protein
METLSARQWSFMYSSPDIDPSQATTTTNLLIRHLQSASLQGKGLTAQVKGVFQIVRVHSGRSAVKTQDQGDMAGKEEKACSSRFSANMGKVESFSLHLLTLVLLRLADTAV